MMTVKVKTFSRLYTGAKIDLDGLVWRVVREGASVHKNGAFITDVTLRATVVCVGDCTYFAEAVE